ncbi:MAG: hypothetical protein GY861_10955 [bacterium]|nr:hypothetical protein [bacterium]
MTKPHPARKKRGRKGGGTQSTNKSENVNKAVPSSPRIRKRAVGTNAIDAIQKWTCQLKPFELRFPHNIETFHEMYTRDDAVGGVLNATYALVENAFNQWRVKPNNKNPDSVAAAEIVKHIFNNMNESTLRTVARNAATFNQFGFSVLEKDYRKPKPDEYSGDLPKGVSYEDLWFIDRLRMIPQRSLDVSEPFVIGGDGRDIKAVRQNVRWFTNSSHALRTWEPPHKTVTIRRNKFMLFTLNGTDSNPMGTSPLEQIWTSWKEKKFFENYLSVGVSKDMAGMPLLEIPQDILDRANTDPNSPEAMLVQSMAEDVAAMHAGEQNMMIMPSDPFSEGSGSNKAYNLKFIGVDGNGKQFDLQEAIQKRKEAIYQSFGALNLISNDSKGGYNQLEGQNAIHLYFVNRIISIITEAINKDLIPQILQLSGIKLHGKDIPRFEAGEIEPISLEEVSKMFQRVKSVNGFLPTKEIWIETYQKLGYDTEHLEDLSQEELFSLSESGSKGSSRSGESMGTSGTGDTQMTVGGDNNMDNTA